MSVRARSGAVLLLDVGNSRLKWSLSREPYRPRQRFMARGTLDTGQIAARAEALLRLLAYIGPIAGLEACNVAGPSIERQLRAAARRAGLPAPRFRRTMRAAGGVRIAYAQPWRLGADRWSALIGAHSEYPRRALCLVAIGTAMTIDLLDAAGRHRGGSIIPGPQLMVESLLERTAGIRRRAGGDGAARALRGAPPAPFARDTRGAVRTGAVHAAAALIMESMRAARALLGRSPLLILSGGAAEVVGPLLRGRYRREDELALRGLAVLRSAGTQFE